MQVNRLSIDDQAAIAALLVEGNSVRATGRLAGVTLNTVLRNLVWLGEACGKLHHQLVRNLRPTRVEADEAWNFIYAKEKSLPYLKKEPPKDAGTHWTWISIDPDSKLVINWHVGGHDPSDAQEFMNDLAARVVSDRLQLTTDMLKHYMSAVETAFGDRVDYAAIHKEFRKPGFTPDGRYEQPRLKDNKIKIVSGEPDPELITTTTIEVQNLRLRMSNRRYTRSTNAFSRRLRNLRASVALNFTFYNFCRIHPKIRVTPAMQAGLTDHVWEIEELIEKLNIEEVRHEEQAA